MKKIQDLHLFERPREKILKNGVKFLNNGELISVLLGSGNKARNIRDISKDIDKLLKTKFPDISVKDLKKIEGVGEAKALQIIASFELVKRFIFKEKIKVQTPETVFNIAQELRTKKQEYFVTLTLDGAYNLITKRVVSIGILNESLVHPREVFVDAISDRAAAIVLIHNHPSGELDPSTEDLLVTRRLIEAGRILGISVLDHIIIGKEGFVSLKEKNLMK